jgi:hypothetical protein
MLERSHLAGTFPKLNVAVIDETPRFFHGLRIVGTDQWNGVLKMAVITDEVCAVFRHMMLLVSGGSIAELSVTDGCRGRCGDATSWNESREKLVTNVGYLTFKGWFHEGN